MTLDPFAPVQAVPEPEPEKGLAPVTSIARPSLDEGEIVITLKGGAGFDAPWIVVHAGSVAEADAILNAEMKSLMDKVQSAAASFRGGAPASAGRTPQPSQPVESTQPPAGAPASPGEGWEFKTGVSKKTGKPWRAWMPPRGRDDLKAVFFD